MGKSVAFWQELSSEANQDRRREKRVPLTFPIDVAGLDQKGHFFSQDTSTANISAKGCCFCLRNKPAQGEVVAVRLANRNAAGEPSRPLLFEIRWIEPSGDGWLVGTSCLQPHNLWKMAFPSPVN